MKTNQKNTGEEMGRGGSRKGAGRPMGTTKPNKKVPFSTKVRPGLKRKMQKHQLSTAKIVDIALCEWFEKVEHGKMRQKTIFDIKPKVKELKTKNLRFDGAVYDHGKDQKRLTGQIKRVFEVMQDGKWRALHEIEAQTGDPQASISAQLRHLRKRRFGGYAIDKQRRGGDKSALWEYRIAKTL